MSGIHPRRQGDYQDPIKHASRPVNMTRKSTTRPVLSLSCFEFFLKRASHSNPPSTGDRLDNHSTSPRRPLNYLNTHLPLSSLLALRLVSHATKSRIDKSRPSPFTHLHLSLPPAPPPSLHALKHLSQSCTHLKITIINPQPTVDNDRPLNLREFIKKCLVLLSKLTTLHVSLPSPAITPLHHETLLSLRQALESSSNSIPHLTTLRLYPVTMRGLISFRSGAFTSFEDAAWVGGNFWQGISRLEMGLVGFMREGNEDGERLGGKGEGQYGGGDSRDWDDDEWAIREEKAKRKRDMVRMGLKILHDFLNSLAPELEVLSFEWLRPSSSPDVTNSAAALHQPNPNPLLLDLEVLRLFPPRGIPPANPPSTGSTSTGSGSSGPASAGSASTGITSPEGTSAKSTSTGATSPEATSPETTSADLGPGSAIAAPTPPENTATIARANTIPASATTAPDVPAPKNPVLATASITSATTATLPTSTNPPPPTTPAPPANPAAPPLATPPGALAPPAIPATPPPPPQPAVPWFSAPPILWPRLQRVYLSGVDGWADAGAPQAQLRMLKGRAAGLRTLFLDAGAEAQGAMGGCGGRGGGDGVRGGGDGGGGGEDGKEWRVVDVSGVQGVEGVKLAGRGWSWRRGLGGKRGRGAGEGGVGVEGGDEWRVGGVAAGGIFRRRMGGGEEVGTGREGGGGGGKEGEHGWGGKEGEHGAGGDGWIGGATGRGWK